MALRNRYVKGDWLVICGQCGLTYYRSQCRFTWDNLLVCVEHCWYLRESQDFVHGVGDKQTVPDPRPDIPATMGQTTVKVAATKNATAIDIDSISGIADNDGIGITLDGNGGIHWTFSDGTPAGDTVTLGSYLPETASVGNVVYLPSINNFTWVTAPPEL